MKYMGTPVKNKDILDNRKNILVPYFVLFSISIILSWKLFRLAYPSQLLWNIHNYSVIILSFISIGLSFKHNLYLKKSRTAVLVTFFILLSIFRLAFFPQADSFYLASSVFCLYFLMIMVFINSSIESGFRCFEVLLILLLFYSAVDYFDANSNLINFFSYEIPSFMEGAMNPLGHQSQFLFSGSIADGFIIRSVGVAGTNYASSALVAATSIYFFILKKRWLFFFSFLLLILWGVGSSLLVAILSILYIKRKSNISFVFIILGVVSSLMVISSRGWGLDVYFNVTNHFGWLDFLIASILGEGKSISSIHTEFRILGLIFSLGFFGVLLLCTMILNYARYSKYMRLSANYNNFNAGLGFILVLFLSTFHYNTFFVFPNIFFFVMLLAFSTIGFMKLNEHKKKSMI